MKTFTDQELVKIALYLDDPYGDGIRKEIIREPSPTRIAALEFVQSGQVDIFGLHTVYIERGREYVQSRTNQSFAKKYILTNN